jgi:glucoamylase
MVPGRARSVLAVRRPGIIAAAGGGLALAAVAVLIAARPGPAVPPLLSQGIAQRPCAPGHVVAVPAGGRARYLPGTSVLRGSTPSCPSAAVAASRAWLASGIIPGTTAAQRSMATRALLDLRLLTRPDGAVLAGWPRPWAYAWPRDSSWAAAALADTGHPVQALRILEFLRRMQSRDGTWAARYWPDGSGQVRDGRPAELDAVGWVPWAVWSWYRAPGNDHRNALAGLWPMVTAAADAASRSLSSGGLPAASMDYWEDSVEVTLATAAAVRGGLRAAADLARTHGDAGQARRWGAAAARLTRAIAADFGRYGYHRLPFTDSGTDTAVTFLGPPFAPASASVARAVRRTQNSVRLPGGGVLPGSGWPGNRTLAWTPETAFFALYDAAASQHQAATAILSWLAAHRTRLGALPEQVNSRGRPASVAPLAWTAAIMLLALVSQQHALPVVPVPPRSQNRIG